MKNVLSPYAGRLAALSLAGCMVLTGCAVRQPAEEVPQVPAGELTAAKVVDIDPITPIDIDETSSEPDTTYDFEMEPELPVETVEPPEVLDEESIQQLADWSSGMGGGELFMTTLASVEKEQLKLANMAQLSDGTYVDIGNIDLSYPRTFNITRPNGSLVTAYANYYIMGTSDPNLPLYYGDIEVTRHSNTGLWGLLVQVPIGTNTYNFNQGGVYKSVTITRYGVGTTQPISVITNGSMTPQISAYARVGEEFTLSCIAPSGASVSANVNGQTVQLSQVAATAQAGIPATFTGKLTLGGNYDSNELTSLGQITYTLNYNGATTTYRSPGTMYAAGQNANVVLEVTDYVIGVTKDETNANSGNSIATVKEGARDYVTGQTSNHYLLQSGGAIKKESVKLLTGTQSISSAGDNLSFSSDGKSETFRFQGARNALHYASLDDQRLTITLKNTTGTTGWFTTNSTIFSSVHEQVNDDNSVTLTFTLNSPRSLWGYDVRYNDSGDVIVYCKKPPSLSGDSSKPLAGVTIVLDPGHGGVDGGAQGVAGTLGPDEAEVNMALTYATKQSLEKLGATVVLTRYDRNAGKTVLFERMQESEKADPDFFISIHHNSTIESSNTNQTKGTEIYYYDTQSKAFAGTIANNLENSIGRENRGVYKSYYVVTKMSYCPSVLAEIGFMVSPVEYEQITDVETIHKTANALANAVLESVRNW